MDAQTNLAGVNSNYDNNNFGLRSDREMSVGKAFGNNTNLLLIPYLPDDDDKCKVQDRSMISVSNTKDLNTSQDFMSKDK